MSDKWIFTGIADAAVEGHRRGEAAMSHLNSPSSRNLAQAKSDLKIANKAAAAFDEAAKRSEESHLEKIIKLSQDNARLTSAINRIADPSASVSALRAEQIDAFWRRDWERIKNDLKQRAMDDLDRQLIDAEERRDRYQERKGQLEMDAKGIGMFSKKVKEARRELEQVNAEITKIDASIEDLNRKKGYVRAGQTKQYSLVPYYTRADKRERMLRVLAAAEYFHRLTAEADDVLAEAKKLAEQALAGRVDTHLAQKLSGAADEARNKLSGDRFGQPVEHNMGSLDSWIDRRFGEYQNSVRFKSETSAAPVAVQGDDFKYADQILRNNLYGLAELFQKWS